MFESRQTKEKRSHFKNLVTMALLDGELDDNERNLLRHRGMQMELSSRDVDAVLRSPQSVRFVVPKSPDDRIGQLHDLVLMMIADGKIHGTEMDFCQTLAIQLGFRPSDVPRMLDVIVEAVRQSTRPSIDARDFLDS